MGEITPAARRIAVDVNAEYGKYHQLFYDAEGNFMAARVSMGDPVPPGWVYSISPTRLGPQPSHWTARQVQNSMDIQDEERVIIEETETAARKYTTKQDAIDYDIIPAIEASGVAKAEEYDIDKIFDAVFEYSEEDQVFIQVAGPDEFWAAVEKAEK